MLIHLDFGDNVFAQILSSFAVPRTKAPALEIHGTGGTDQHRRAPIGTTPTARSTIFIRDESPLGVEDWATACASPVASPHSKSDRRRGAALCGLPGGREEPILTAEHACHVLEIMLAAGRAAASGETMSLTTRF